VNYRHAYHAGNFADVIKHVVLCRLLSYLKLKDKPFFVLDSHAGRGLYDLSAEEALRTQEAQDGIFKLDKATDVPSEIETYLSLVRRLNPQKGEINQYPGSPLIIKNFLREKDRLVAVELHPQDVIYLRKALKNDYRIHVEARNGYEAVKALLPPLERRGLVLIDPPFEQTDEFQNLNKALIEAQRRWPTGTYAVWYPIKSRPPVDKFLKSLSNMAFKEIWVAELAPFSYDNPQRLNGCGLVLINPPYVFEAELTRILPWLCHLLSHEAGASWRLERLIPNENEGKNAPSA